MHNALSNTNTPAAGKLDWGVGRLFTQPEVHPFDQLEWEIRKAVITNEKGRVLFEQDEVEVPRSWSLLV